MKKYFYFSILITFLISNYGYCANVGGTGYSGMTYYKTPMSSNFLSQNNAKINKVVSDYNENLETDLTKLKRNNDNTYDFNKDYSDPKSDSKYKNDEPKYKTNQDDNKKDYTTKQERDEKWYFWRQRGSYFGLGFD